MRGLTNPRSSLSDLPFSRKEPDLRQVAHYIPTMDEWREINDLPRYRMRDLYKVPNEKDMLTDFAPGVDPPQYFVMETSRGDVLVNTEGYDYPRYMVHISCPNPRFGYPMAGRSRFSEPYHVETWFERDRAHVELRDADDKTVVEWWDVEVQEAVEDGFLDPRDWEGSAIEYAEEMGLI